MQINIKKQGAIAGVSLIIMALVAGFSFGYAHSSIVANSPDVTIQNLLANKSLFIAELIGWSLIFIADLIVAIALYYFFRNTSKQVSLITASIRIVYTIILGIAIVQLFKIVPFLSIDSITSDNFNASDSYSYFQMFQKIWSIGLIIFGLHLIGLGYLSLKSTSIHWLFGYLLYLGGISYTFINATRQLSLFNPEVINSIENVLTLPMALAEILLAIWLIYNGFRKRSSSSVLGQIT